MSVVNFHLKNISKDLIKSLEDVIYDCEYIADGKEIYIEDEFEFSVMRPMIHPITESLIYYLTDLEKSFTNNERMSIDEFNLNNAECMENFRNFIRSLRIYKYVYDKNAYIGHKIIQNNLYS